MPNNAAGIVYEFTVWPYQRQFTEGVTDSLPELCDTKVN